MSQPESNAQKSTIGRAHPIQLINRGLSAVAPGLATMVAEQLFVTVFRHKRPPREERWAEGAAATSIASPHGDLAAWVWGDGPKTVLLVHGWAGRGLQMGAFAAPLIESGYRVVAYDAPAHGGSPGRQANLFKLTEGLVAVADSVGPLHGVIAHSLGTTSVLLAASRGELEFDRFVAVAPMADTRTMSVGYAQTTGFSTSVVERMRRRFEKRFSFLWDEIEPLRLAVHLKAETLVIHDHDDEELPVGEGEALARAIPSCRSHLTRGLGHRRILRDPKIVEAAAGFVARRASIIHQTEMSEQPTAAPPA